MVDSHPARARREAGPDGPGRQGAARLRPQLPAAAEEGAARHQGQPRLFREAAHQLEAQNLERRSEAEQVAKKLDGVIVVLIRQAGESGQLYGSVTARDIADAVTAARLHRRRAARSCSTRRSRPSACTSSASSSIPEVSVTRHRQRRAIARRGGDAGEGRRSAAPGAGGGGARAAAAPADEGADAPADGSRRVRARRHQRSKRGNRAPSRTAEGVFFCAQRLAAGVEQRQITGGFRYPCARCPACDTGACRVATRCRPSGRAPGAWAKRAPPTPRGRGAAARPRSRHDPDRHRRDVWRRRRRGGRRPRPSPAAATRSSSSARSARTTRPRRARSPPASAA